MPQLDKLAYLLTGIAASGIVFFVAILTIAHLFALLAGPVARMFAKPPTRAYGRAISTMWATSSRRRCRRLFVCLIIAVTFLAPRERSQSRTPVQVSSSWIADLIGFFRSGVCAFFVRLP